MSKRRFTPTSSPRCVGCRGVLLSAAAVCCGFCRRSLHAASSANAGRGGKPLGSGPAPSSTTKEHLDGTRNPSP